MFLGTKNNGLKNKEYYYNSIESNTLTEKIIGSRRLDNIFWAIVTFIAGIGFLITGLSSYFKKQIIFFITSSDISFIPQGIVMSFYGTLAIFISIFLWFTIILDIGSGYNHFNKVNNSIKIVRLGFPGKHRIISLEYSINQIKSVQISIKEGLNPKHEIYLCTKNNQTIPLTQVSIPIPLSILEQKASKLAQFLGVSLEGIKN